MMKKKKILLVLIGLITYIMFANNVQAYQSRPNVNTKSDTVINMFVNTRKMEIVSGGPLGLDANVNDDGIETSASNNIDVHLTKNTEWGTVAMLSASIYGTVPTTQNDWTTGNSTGIYKMRTYPEWGVAFISNEPSNKIINAGSKYYNSYSSGEYILGDATIETYKWYNAPYAEVKKSYALSRGSANIMSQETATLSQSRGGRAVIVNGEGF